MCICLRQSSAKSRLLRPVAGAKQSRISAPNSSCGHTSTARHESCCRNGQPRRWSAPASEELAKRSFRQALITCFCPHLESCALPEKKSCKCRNDPVSFITVNCADVCAVVRSTLGFSVTASDSCELEIESFVASSFNATKLSLDW